MSFLITGGTGFVGRELIAKIIAGNTDVKPTPIIMCTRKIERVDPLAGLAAKSFSADSRDKKKSFEIVPYQWSPTAGPIDLNIVTMVKQADSFEPNSDNRSKGNWGLQVASALKQSPISTVVNLMGESVAEGRWTQEKKRRIRASRVQGTKNLVDSLIESNQLPQVFISASAIGFYAEQGDQTITETAAAGVDFLAEVGSAWEAEADRLSQHGVRVVKLRLGLVMGSQGGALQKMIPIFRWGVGGRLGSGQQWMSWIHIDDLTSMIVWAMTEFGLTGSFNAVAPHPIRNIDFTKQLAAKLNRPAIFPVPAFALKIALGEFSQELLTSKRVIPQAAIERGFKFRFETFSDAIGDLLS